MEGITFFEISTTIFIAYQRIKQALNMKDHHFPFLQDIRKFYCRKIVEVALHHMADMHA
jgi:hypothetical protein